MKKRILAALLAAGMLFGAVTMSGCSKKENNDESEASGVVLLNMYVLTSEETGAKAKLDVQKAINEITVPNEKLLVKVNYVTPDEYAATIEAAEASVEEYAKLKGIDPDELAAEQAAEAAAEAAEAEEGAEEKKDAKDKDDKKGKKGKEDDDGVKTFAEMSFNEVIDYVFNMEDVELEKPQLDVLVVDDYDTFKQMVEDEKLAEIDVKYNHKTITKYLHPTILATTTVKKKVYGIPANGAMNGTYKFLVFNKDLLDKYGYTVSDLRRIEDMGEYFAAVKAGEAGVYPINDLPSLSGVELYDDILLAQSTLTTVSSTASPVYIGNNTAYKDYLKAAASFRENGYVAAADGVDGGQYAVEYVESTELLEHEWTDEDGTTYEAYLYDIARVDAKDAFKAAMCVSASSLNREASAKLVELFNTDPELCNLLVYGIEGTHYRLEDGVVTFIDTDPENTYRMDPDLIGNSYILYPTEGREDYFAKSKLANLSSAPSTFFGFDIGFDGDTYSEAVYECVKLFSAEALRRVESGEMTVDEAFNIAARELVALGCTFNDSGALVGVFGKIGTMVSSNNAELIANYKLGEEAKTYNDVYKTRAEVAAEEAAEEAEKAAEEAAEKAAEEAALDAQIEAANKAAEAEKAAEADPNADETAEG